MALAPVGAIGSFTAVAPLEALPPVGSASALRDITAPSPVPALAVPAVDSVVAQANRAALLAAAAGPVAIQEAAAAAVLADPSGPAAQAAVTLSAAAEHAQVRDVVLRTQRYGGLPLLAIPLAIPSNLGQPLRSDVAPVVPIAGPARIDPQRPRT